MRSNLLLKLVSVVLFFPLNNLSFSSPILPYRTMEVPYCIDCEVDGIMEDSYSEEQSTDWVSPDQLINWEGPPDFTAVFHLAYNSRFLYIIAFITDDIAEKYHWGYSSEWMFDNMEWFIQLDTNTSYTEYDSLTEQIRICRV